jgi:ribonuclease P protein component
MRDTIKRHKDFAGTESDPVFRCPLFIARARPTLWPGGARYGLIATKRTLKRAVARNRAKRLLRVWIRESESQMSPDLDYVFIVRAPILEAALQDGLAMMGKAIRKLKTGDAPKISVFE